MWKNLGVKLLLMRNEEVAICSNHSVDLWADVWRDELVLGCMIASCARWRFVSPCKQTGCAHLFACLFIWKWCQGCNENLFFFPPPLSLYRDAESSCLCHVSKLFFKCGIGGSASETFVKTHQVWVTEINETWHPRWVHLKCKLYEWIYCGTLHYAVFKWPLSICFSASRSSRSHSPPRRGEVCTARFLIVQNAARVWPLFSFFQKKKKEKVRKKTRNKVKYVQWSFQTHLKVISFSTCRCILSPCPLCRLQKVGSSLCQLGGLSN